MSTLKRQERWTGVMGAGVMMLVSLGLARAVMETESIDAGPSAVAGTVLGVAAALVVMMLGALPCLAALAAVSAFQVVLPTVSVLGEVDLTAADAFFLALVIWWLATQGFRARRDEYSVRFPIRSWPLLLFVAYAGLSLLYVAVIDQHHLGIAAVSWLRLAQAAALGLVTAAFVRTKRDVTIIVGAYALAAIFAVSAAVNEGRLVGERTAGLLNANSLGLISGVLVLLAFFPAVTHRVALRIPLGVVGCLGLIQGKSTGATVATSVALLLGLVFASRGVRAPPLWRTVKGISALVLALAIGYSAIHLIRPENDPLSRDFQHGTAWHHLVLGTAGLEIAKRNPLIGVGWSRSGLDEVIRAPEIGTELRVRFPETKVTFFPDSMTRGAPSIHNGYVQTLAELGAVGMALLLFALWSAGRDIARLLSRLPRKTAEWWQIWFLAWGLVLVLVYLNSAPLFGGQVETVTAVMFLGAIAGLGRGILSSREVGERASVADGAGRPAIVPAASSAPTASRRLK